MKIEEIEDEKLYRRGRDYPPYATAKKGEGSVKMPMSLYGKEIKFWFTEEELKDYPNPKGYTGSLP